MAQISLNLDLTRFYTINLCKTVKDSNVRYT